MIKSDKPQMLCAMTLATALVATPGGAAADSPQQETLRGDYGLSAMEVCVETPREPPPAMGFDANRMLLQDAAAVPAVIAGILSFATNGTVALDGKISDLFINQITAGETPIISESPLQCDGSYGIGADRRLNLELACEVPLSDFVRVMVGPLVFEGFMPRHRLAANLASLEGNIQTESIEVGGTVVEQRERVCVTTGSLARL